MTEMASVEVLGLLQSILYNLPSAVPRIAEMANVG